MGGSGSGFRLMLRYTGGALRTDLKTAPCNVKGYLLGGFNYWGRNSISLIKGGNDNDKDIYGSLPYLERGRNEHRHKHLTVQMGIVFLLSSWCSLEFKV